MFDTYFDKYNHKCQLDLGQPFQEILRNKSFLRTWFMNHSVISRDYILLRCRPRSFSSLRKEIMDQWIHFPYAIHPFSEIAFWCDFIWLFYVFFWFIERPYSIFHHLQSDNISDNRGSVFLALLLLVICMMDCIRRFLTGYIILNSDDTQEIVLNFKRVSLHYLTTYFLFDFISCLSACFSVELDPSLAFYITWDMFEYLRLIRLPTMFMVIKNIMRLYHINHDYIDIFNSILILIIIVHWVSSFSVMGGIIERNLVPNAFEWYDDIFTPNSTMSHKYVKCCHRTLSILTGAGYLFYLNKVKSVNDMIYTIFTAVLGHILTFCIFAEIFVKLDGIRSSSDKFVEMNIEISKYIERENLSKAILNKIKTYYAYNYKHSYFNETELLAAVPISLQQNILLHNANKLVVNIEYFNNLPNPIVANILSLLEKQIVFPGDIIFRNAEIGDSMYFLLNGTVAEFTESGREVFHFEDGSAFGEIALLAKDVEYHATVVAIETSELYRFEERDLPTLLSYCPDIVDKMRNLWYARREILDMMEARFQRYYIQGVLDEYRINRVPQESFF